MTGPLPEYNERMALRYRDVGYVPVPRGESTCSIDRYCLLPAPQLVKVHGS